MTVVGLLDYSAIGSGMNPVGLQLVSAIGIDRRDMATAATMRRYPDTPGGAIYGFAAEPSKGLPTPGSAGASRRASGVVAGVELRQSRRLHASTSLAAHPGL